ncbi:MAG: CHAT domain-containing protein [Stigonema ocellatum SAG 48.90 = DSM 106950]|nr:CHAT domain-containing protein [Stigonema ocellatum SAG 48.90 = DSM 106950]
MKKAVLTLEMNSNHTVKIYFKTENEGIKRELPSFSSISTYYEKWQQAINQSLITPSRLEAEEPSNNSPVDIKSCADNLKEEINSWLKHEDFKKVRENIIDFLESSQKHTSRIIIKTDDSFLQRVPWYCWEILSGYPKTEVTLSSDTGKTKNHNYLPPYKSQLRLLIILGDGTNISLDRDQKNLEKLKRKTHINIDVFPAANHNLNELCNIAKLKESLANSLRNGYDIIFFAGHGVGKSENQTDKIRFNINNTLLDISIADFEDVLKIAIIKGLRLAIFNSCMGMTIGHHLDKNHALTTIVMREKIRDDLAIIFLENFLEYFYSGQPLCLAVKQAREKLREESHTDESSTWLPVIFQKESEESICLKDWILPNILELLFSVGLTGFNFGLAAIFISTWVSTVIINPAYWLIVLIICGLTSGLIFAFFPYLSKHKYLLILAIITLTTSIVIGLIYGAWTYVYSFMIALFSVFTLSAFCLIYYIRQPLSRIVNFYIRLSQR